MADRVIYKYPITPFDVPVLTLRDPKVRLLAEQDHQLCVWIEHDQPGKDIEPNTNLTIVAYGTGHVLESGGEYVGSVQDGPFVWHFYAYATLIAGSKFS
jgi:hypothetical protein